MFQKINRSNVVILCPDNDAEAHMILLLAAKAGITMIRSEQPHGAKLDREPDIVNKLLAAKKPEAWIIEIPGETIEAELRERGLIVRIIDHHTYKETDRLTDPETGTPNKSSLEQFLTLAQISDEELHGWDFDPKTVHGVGIMDALFAQGLRDAGYTKEEINKVLETIKVFVNEIDPEHERIRIAAEEAWKGRTERDGYILIDSKSPERIRGALSHISIREEVDTRPLLISIRGGEEISVQNVDTATIQKLKERITGNTYTFGTGRCWGVNNTGQKNIVTLEMILQVLGI